MPCCEVADGWEGGSAGIRPEAWAGCNGGPGIYCSGSPSLEATGELADGAERSDLLKSMARWMQLSSMLGIVLVGALHFTLGASSAPLMVTGAPAQFAGAAERVSRTVSKQMAR